MVKIEGTLDEIRELLGNVGDTVTAARKTVEKATKTVKQTKKVKRKLSAWQKYIANSKNHIKFKSGPRKGRLDLAKMSRAFKRSRK